MGTRFPNLGRLRSPASPGRARKPLKRRRARRGTPIAARGDGRLVESRAKQYVRCPPPGEGGSARARPRLIFGDSSWNMAAVIPPDEFRRVLGHFATGVTIVTTRDTDGRPTGLTVSAFCSVSLDPPQILVCVDHKSQSYPALRDRDRFAVNFLGDRHEDVSRRFATTRLDKFDGVPHKLSNHGVPLVEGALAQLECRTVSRHVEGDHTILVALVEEARNGAGEPLLYFRGKYRGLADTPSGASS